MALPGCPVTTDEAIGILAAHILARAARDVDWMDWPNIGTDDWHTLCDLLDRLAPIEDGDVEQACAHLRARAGGPRGSL